MTLVRPSSKPNYLRKLRRLLREVSEQPLPDRVHQLRTTIRRAETFLSSHELSAKRDVAKLLQQLAKLRRRAGRVRDIDVQTIALRSVQIGRQEEAKALLMAELEAQRSKQQKKLLAGIEDKFSPRLRERMQKVEYAIAFAGGAEGVAGTPGNIALERLSRSVRDLVRAYRKAQPFSPRGLHQFRIQCKKTRYLAELLPGNAELLLQLKTMQDVIGDWHDWLTLAQNAARIAGLAKLALLAHLQNVTQAKFTEAISVCGRVVNEIQAGAYLRQLPREKNAVETEQKKSAPEKKRAVRENKKSETAKKKPAGSSARKQAAPAAG
ncbi:MAG TPA: CHAD domain-containing protein [Terriglobales bacterium]|nr:CHAD domain-containing protein [Terriglobales bacterium]